MNTRTLIRESRGNRSRRAFANTLLTTPERVQQWENGSSEPDAWTLMRLTKLGVPAEKIEQVAR